LAEKRGVRLEDLSLEELQGFSRLVERDVFAVLEHEAAVRRRAVSGGTGPEPLAAQLKDLYTWLLQVR